MLATPTDDDAFGLIVIGEVNTNGATLVVDNTDAQMAHHRQRFAVVHERASFGQGLGVLRGVAFVRGEIVLGEHRVRITRFFANLHVIGDKKRQ